MKKESNGLCWKGLPPKGLPNSPPNGEGLEIPKSEKIHVVYMYMYMSPVCLELVFYQWTQLYISLKTDIKYKKKYIHYGMLSTQQFLSNLEREAKVLSLPTFYKNQLSPYWSLSKQEI